MCTISGKFTIDNVPFAFGLKPRCVNMNFHIFLSMYSNIYRIDDATPLPLSHCNRFEHIQKKILSISFHNIKTAPKVVLMLFTSQHVNNRVWTSCFFIEVHLHWEINIYFFLYSNNQHTCTCQFKMLSQQYSRYLTTVCKESSLGPLKPVVDNMSNGVLVYNESCHHPFLFGWLLRRVHSHVWYGNEKNTNTRVLQCIILVQ